MMQLSLTKPEISGRATRYKDKISPQIVLDIAEVRRVDIERQWAMLLHYMK